MANKKEIVALIGCTKFKEEFLIAARELALQGFLVLPPNVYDQADELKLNFENRLILSKLQEFSIDTSDSVYVINKEGYIDEETRKAIDYAEKTGKEIFYAYVQHDNDCCYGGRHFCPARTITELLRMNKGKGVLPDCKHHASQVQ